MLTAKLIAVSNEAYNELLKRKGSDKSFSDVILSMIKSKQKGQGDIMRFAGIFKGDKEFAKMAKKIRSDRKKFKARTFEGF